VALGGWMLGILILLVLGGLRTSFLVLILFLFWMAPHLFLRPCTRRAAKLIGLRRRPSPLRPGHRSREILVVEDDFIFKEK
jgi:hypothetical protein